MTEDERYESLRHCKYDIFSLRQIFYTVFVAALIISE